MIVLAAAGVVASLLGAYFGFVAVRKDIRWWPRTRRRITVDRVINLSAVHRPYDAFISYAETDLASAELIAVALRNAGLHVFLAAWIDVGVIEYLEKERALLDSANGVLLFSRATMSRPAIRDEYAALLTRAHAGDRLFIPVLIEDVDLPPFAANRRPVDLRDCRPTDLPARITPLIRALSRSPSIGA